MDRLHITSIQFSHYKAFSNYEIRLLEFNVLVGPNNSGKSTVIGAFRILHEGIRKARSKSPDRIDIDGVVTLGYELNIDDLPVAAENIFHDYDESRPARVTFSLSNGNSLALHFPERGLCVLVPESARRMVRSPKDFREAFNIEIAFVPILGPVEQREPLFAKEAARRALLTSGASRNFRNIWFHYPEGFERFQELVRTTWPGMDIQKPEFGGLDKELAMFCPEGRRPREICWAGYGFQVWCQMLTFIVKGADASLLVIDEPDIYLHSDLQRQLVALLANLGPDIVIATHSTEIISECDPSSLLNIDKKSIAATRVNDHSQLKRVFAALGSNMNPTLTQLAKTRRVVLVEGPAFRVLSHVARTAGLMRVANRADFALIQVDRLDTRRAVDLVSGAERTLGSSVLGIVILDQRYRSESELADLSAGLAAHNLRVHRLDRNEFDNFLLVPEAISRAVESRLRDRSRRSGGQKHLLPDIRAMIDSCIDALRHDVAANLIAQYTRYAGLKPSAASPASLNEAAMLEFERRWAEPSGPSRLVSGSELLSRLNGMLGELLDITVTDVQIAGAIRHDEIPANALTLLDILDQFSSEDMPRGSKGQVDAWDRIVQDPGDVKAALARTDAGIASHRPVHSGDAWDDVPIALPPAPRRR